METTEIIAELRKQGLLEAADRLESLDKRWKVTRVERDQARRMRERAERLLAEKPTGDLISRRAVLAALSSRLSIVESVPAVDAEPVVHAHWVIERWRSGYIKWCNCSNCGNHPKDAYAPPKFCDNCGAHMDEEVTE